MNEVTHNELKVPGYRVGPHLEYSPISVTLFDEIPLPEVRD